MQHELITIEGGRPKKRLNIVAALVVCALAIPLPVKARLAFTFAVNFVANHVLATARLVLAFLCRQLTHLLIFLTYVFVVGPLAAWARLMGRDYLGATAADGSFFQPKEPPDAGPERFERQY